IEKENIISENFENENLVFVSDKKSLKSVQRKPYFHFLADVSIGKKIFSEVFTERIEKFLNDNKEFSENAQISFVNTYVNKSKITNKLKDQFDKQSFEGGFFLDRAVKSTLYDSYLNGGDTYPVLVVVTDSIQNAILNKDFSDLKFTFPESNEFYNLNENGKLEAHSLLTDPVKSFVDSSQNLFNHTVREFILPDNKKIYLQYNDMPDIVLKKDIFKIDDVDIKVKNWESALTLQGYWMSQTLHPETSDKDWLNLVRYSFVSKIMTPVTAYMTVENEAQKEMLKRKQNQVLSGNKSLDLGEDTERMSEPGFVLMAILLMLILFLIKKKKKILIRKSI
ncbi:MAG: MSEP-CTERM sorting domain-containing protein, partial [Ignavibacteria bacterium]|nr:MSEP-CTERM sorting domain-containing protein [Ignavibacteria bacterium]